MWTRTEGIAGRLPGHFFPEVAREVKENERVRKTFSHPHRWASGIVCGLPGGAFGARWDTAGIMGREGRLRDGVRMGNASKCEENLTVWNPPHNPFSLTKETPLGGNI